MSDDNATNDLWVQRAQLCENAIDNMKVKYNDFSDSVASRLDDDDDNDASAGEIADRGAEVVGSAFAASVMCDNGG